MAGSNQKPPGKIEAPQEPFKRAVAGCLRAMAQVTQLDVAYAAEKPNVVGNAGAARVRLPEPPRKLTRQDAAILRGHADSIALKLACHDAAIHRRLLPHAPGPRRLRGGRAGPRRGDRSKRMDGVAQNLDAMLEDRSSMPAMARSASARTRRWSRPSR